MCLDGDMLLCADNVGKVTALVGNAVVTSACADNSCGAICSVGNTCGISASVEAFFETVTAVAGFCGSAGSFVYSWRGSCVDGDWEAVGSTFGTIGAEGETGLL